MLPATTSDVLLFAVVFANVGTPAQDINLAFTFTGLAPADNFTSLTNPVHSSSNVSYAVAITTGQAASLAEGGTLSMVVSGTPGYDFVLDGFALSSEVASAAPEPQSLALVGLALAAAAACRRPPAVSVA